jgi:hypothetical protein
MMLVFEVYQKRKFCVVIAWLSGYPKCLLVSAICELNIKKEVTGKKSVSKDYSFLEKNF